MGELSAKLVAKCFWHCEVEEELKERGLIENGSLHLINLEPMST
jgi:hypothetical protein